MPKHIQRRRIWPTVIVTLLVLGIGGFSAVQVSDWSEASFKTKQPKTSQTATKPQPKVVNQVKLSVPLVEQMTEPKLYNGCEVTSLTMMLNYYHINVTKNQLATKLTSVPLDYDNGEHGNPNVGFVGDVTGANPGLGVYHGPIVKLAKTQTSQVKDLTGSSFDQVIAQLELGRPVWTITTGTFAPVSTMKTWQTPQGSVKVTYDMHSVVIVGFDRAKKVVYINNPYGYKQQAVNWSDFEGAYNQMGKQAVVLTLNH
ncbi:C39 family peptidase [Lactiplantibacillus sp. WILCCON 0030]|uniref:C39 family peptidase n=1 Tax=Lactiplantibacillus brownii TaxID=3069269 RepID=A0ABU1ACJ0_9LACO|nr:C39 family peptidase [Lactiplantibacillus brownii]MDQ7938122.1 C39 family peptidase [Lactiplantibacillus brownii]